MAVDIIAGKKEPFSVHSPDKVGHWQMLTTGMTSYPFTVSRLAWGNEKGSRYQAFIPIGAPRWAAKEYAANLQVDLEKHLG